jgi:DNA-binding NarL/FixJ family response regulator
VKPIRVLLADDHTLFREGVRALLERAPGIVVVGEARDGREALELAERTLPDVVLMDVAMPGLDGLEATRQLARRAPRARVVVVSMREDREAIRELLRAGIAGYVLKGAASAELVRAVEVAGAGGCYLSPAVASLVVEDYAHGAAHATAPAEVQLTPREREVLQLVVEGLSTAEIARRLRISRKTVEVHRANIGAKLQIRDVPGLVRYAIRRGWLDP